MTPEAVGMLSREAGLRPMQTVSIIQREIPHYRVPFFSQLNARSEREGLRITVFSAAESALPCNEFRHRTLPSQPIGPGGGCLWFQGLTEAVVGSDIIVGPQELQCLNVPYLWARRRKLCRSWIWWGHGYNFQATQHAPWSLSIKESAKRFMTRHADGLITYTEGGAGYWRKNGMPAERVRAYYNTIDVDGVRAAAAKVSEERLAQARAALELGGARVLLFSGRLYAEKRVDFLLRAFARLQQSEPSVALLIIGDGPERKELEALRDGLKLRQVHFLGACTEPERLGVYFRLAELLVIPGLVGLAIVHGYAFGLPVITTDYPGHSPEIEYLTPETGVMTAQNVQDYAAAIEALLKSPEKLRAMRDAARGQGDKLRLSLSVDRFLNALIAFSNSAGREGAIACPQEGRAVRPAGRITQGKARALASAPRRRIFR
jgi:glycosyltransferase involved in cell wall biosynthesis